MGYLSSSDVDKILTILGGLNFENQHLASDFGNSLSEFTYDCDAIPAIVVSTLGDVASRLDVVYPWVPDSEGARKVYEVFRRAVESLVTLNDRLNILSFGDESEEIDVEKKFRRHSGDIPPLITCCVSKGLLTEMSITKFLTLVKMEKVA